MRGDVLSVLKRVAADQAQRSNSMALVSRYLSVVSTFDSPWKGDSNQMCSAGVISGSTAWVDKWRRRQGEIHQQQVRCVQSFMVGNPFSVLDPPVLKEFRKYVVTKQGSRRKKDECAREAIKSIRRLNARDFAHLLDCCRRGKYYDEKLFEVIGKELWNSPSLVHQMAAQNLAMILESLGILWHDSNYKQSFFLGFHRLVLLLVKECLNRERLGYSTFQVRDVSMALNGLGLLFRKDVGLEVEPDVAKLLDVLLNKMALFGNVDKCRPDRLIALLEACAMVNHKNAKAIDGVCDSIYRRLSGYSRQYDMPWYVDFDGSKMASVVTALAKLNHRHDNALDAFGGILQTKARLFADKDLATIMQGFALLGYRSSRTLHFISKEVCGPKRLPGLSERPLSSFFRDFSVLGYKEDDTLDCLLTEIRKPSRLSAFDGCGASNVVYGLGRIFHFDKDVFEHFLGKSDVFMQDWTSDEMYLFVNGLCLLKDKMDKRFVDKHVVKCLGALAGDLGKRSATNALTSIEQVKLLTNLGQMRYYDPQSMDTVLNKIAKSKEQVEIEEVSKLLRICANFDHPNDAFLDKLGKWVDAPEHAESFKDPKTLISWLWSFVVLRGPHVPVVSTLCSRLESVSVEDTNFNVTSARQVLEIHLAFQAHAQNGVLSERFLKLVDQCRGKLRTQSRLSPALSAVKKEIIGNLSNHKMDGGPFGNGLVDVLLEDPRIAINLTKAEDYSINVVNGELKMLQACGFQNKSLEKMGCKVVNVVHFEWTKKHKKDRRAWLQQELSKVGFPTESSNEQA